AGFLGVDRLAVEVPGVLGGLLDGRPGDLVEDHPPDRHLGREHLQEVPGDGLALPILIGGEIDLVGVLEKRLELGDLRLLLRRDDVERLEVVVDIDAPPLGPGLVLVGGGDLLGLAGQVTDVADARFDGEPGAEEARDGLRLGRRFDDHEGLRHGSSIPSGAVWPARVPDGWLRCHASPGLWCPSVEKHLIETFGTIGLLVTIFAESCLIFFLPGDTLLFTAGLLASQGKLNLAVILIGSFVAAVAGNQVAYALGNKAGPTLFKPGSRLFKAEYVARAEEYFEKFGSR